MNELRELSFEECESLLRHTRLARIAMRDYEGAYLVPITFAFGDGAIYGHSAPGRKVMLMRRWPHVAVQVDHISNFSTWRSVLIQGKWHELTAEADKVRARALLLKAFQGELWWVGAGHGHRTSLADAILYRIDIQEISGLAQNA